jgi:two-component system chemotaxis sensor kinase CheA
MNELPNKKQNDEPLDKQQNDDERSLNKEVKKIKSHVADDSIRVNVTLLNSLLNLASELVLGRNQLLRAMEKYHKDIAGIDPILQNIDHITTELQEKIMQTRMQSIANVFNKFPRIIRDMAKKLGKEIELHIEGGDVELDKSIIEILNLRDEEFLENFIKRYKEPFLSQVNTIQI